MEPMSERLPALPRRAFLVAALGVVVTACSQTSRASGGSSPTRVDAPNVTVPGVSLPGGTIPAAQAKLLTLGMIGDSITKLSTPSLKAVFVAQGIPNVTIDAEVSRRIKVGNGKSEPLNGEQVLTNMNKIGLDPDVWVFALGTNDLTAYDADGFATVISTMLGMTKPDTPVVWVDTYRPKTLQQTKVFNLVVRDQASKRPHTTVASWFDVASAAPDKLLSKDDVHPSDAGQQAFAAVVGAAVAGAS